MIDQPISLTELQKDQIARNMQAARERQPIRGDVYVRDMQALIDVGTDLEIWVSVLLNEVPTTRLPAVESRVDAARIAARNALTKGASK